MIELTKRIQSALLELDAGEDPNEVRQKYDCFDATFDELKDATRSFSDKVNVDTLMQFNCVGKHRGYMDAKIFSKVAEAANDVPLFKQLYDEWLPLNLEFQEDQFDVGVELSKQGSFLPAYFNGVDRTLDEIATHIAQYSSRSIRTLVDEGDHLKAKKTPNGVSYTLAVAAQVEEFRKTCRGDFNEVANVAEKTISAADHVANALHLHHAGAIFFGGTAHASTAVVAGVAMGPWTVLAVNALVIFLAAKAVHWGVHKYKDRQSRKKQNYVEIILTKILSEEGGYADKKIGALINRKSSDQLSSMPNFDQCEFDERENIVVIRFKNLKQSILSAEQLAQLSSELSQYFADVQQELARYIARDVGARIKRGPSEVRCSYITVNTSSGGRKQTEFNVDIAQAIHELNPGVRPFKARSGATAKPEGMAQAKAASQVTLARVTEPKQVLSIIVPELKKELGLALARYIASSVNAELATGDEEELVTVSTEMSTQLTLLETGFLKSLKSEVDQFFNRSLGEAEIYRGCLILRD